MEINPNSDLSKITKDVAPSTITLEKPTLPVYTKPEIYRTNSVIWQQKSEELLNDYKQGWNLGKYEDTKKFDIPILFNRLSSVIINSLVNEIGKEGKSSENLILHFNMLKSIMTLIARDFESVGLKKAKPQSLLAYLHGFVDSYIETKLKGD
jgi:hypothetical protein